MSKNAADSEIMLQLSSAQAERILVWFQHRKTAAPQVVQRMMSQMHRQLKLHRLLQDVKPADIRELAKGPNRKFKAPRI